MLVIDKDRTRRESTLAPDLRIHGERLKTLDINDACRYLGYWGTGNGDMSATREVVRDKARVARDLIKSHQLTQELSAELFAQKGIGTFRSSAALIEWSQSELEGLQTCPQQIPDLYIKAPRSWLIVYTRSPNLLNSCFALPDGPRCRCPAHLFRDEH